MGKEEFILIASQLRAIIDECICQEDLYWGKAEELLDEELLIASYALSYNCRATTDSCAFLAERARIYDASILRRTIIQGTLKFIYLLTAPNYEEERIRVNEYLNLLPRKQFASNEQPVKTSFNISRYGDTDIKAFVQKHFVDYINNHKTKQNEGSHLRMIHKMWEYLNLSKKVATECEEWRKIQHSMDEKYSTSNDYVHCNATGCFETMIAILRESNDEDFVEYQHYCFPIDIMLDMCSLSFVRAEILAKRIKIDSKELNCTIKKNKSFLEMIEKMRVTTCREIIRKLNI